MLAVMSSGLQLIERTFRQLSCTGQKEREMFPVTTTSSAVSNPQFLTSGTAGMVTCIVLPVGK